MSLHNILQKASIGCLFLNSSFQKAYFTKENKVEGKIGII